MARSTKRPGPPARDRLRAARQQIYHDLILDTAEAVFAERGFGDAKMHDVAQAARISLRTLYATFPSKAELLVAIHDHRCGEVFRLGAEAMCEHDDATESLMAGVKAGVEFLLGHPNFLRLHLREGNAWAIGPGEESQADRWREGLAMQAEIFERGIAEGIFIPEDPMLLAKMMTALYQVQLADWFEREGIAGLDDPANRQALVERIQAHVRRAVLVPEDAPGTGTRGDSSAGVRARSGGAGIPTAVKGRKRGAAPKRGNPRAPTKPNDR